MMIRQALLCVLLALLSISVASAASWMVQPTGQSYCTGSTNYAARFDGPIEIYGGATSGTVRKPSGFMKFDVSSIPDGTVVTAIEWHFHVASTDWPWWSVTPLTADPSLPGSTAANLWDDIEAEVDTDYYNYLNESVTYLPGWKMVVLGGTADADLTAVLASGQDWFAFGGTSRDDHEENFQLIHGYTDPNPPYLVVLDDPPPTNDICAFAEPIPGAPGTYSIGGNTRFAIDDYDCNAPCVGNLPHPGPDLVYEISLPEDCKVCATLNQAVMDWNGGIYLVTDCADVDGTCVAGSSGWIAGSDDETFCYTSPVNATYYLVVDGRSFADGGQFQLDVQISCLPAPSELVCTDTGNGVDLVWTNNDLYDTVEVLVDGVVEAVLPGTATSATVVPEEGHHCFQVCGHRLGDDTCSEPCCLIYGYDQEELLWDFDQDDGGFMVQGTGRWQWGEAGFGNCSIGAFGRLWATDLNANYGSNTCWLLDSPPVIIGAQGSFLAIDHCYETEFGPDGGILWFTTDDFWYHSFEPEKGYDTTISASTPCAWVAGYRGFSGSSGGWVTDHWDLTAEGYKGESVSMRFAFGSDDVMSAPGWMIDNIVLLSNEFPPFSCDYSVTPTSGTVPFGLTHRLTMVNTLSGGAVWTRRVAGRIDVLLANGSSVSNWRSGYTNIAPGTQFTTTFSMTMPAIGRVIGDNTFTLLAMDVTPAPYNQPPYPPDGNTCTTFEVVTAYAP